MKRILLLLVSFMSFSVMAQESKYGGVPVEEYQPHGIPMGDSYTGFMTCTVVDVIAVGFEDGKATRYSGITDGFEIADKIVLKVQYNTSGMVPQFMINDTEDHNGTGWSVNEIVYANSKYTFNESNRNMTLSEGDRGNDVYVSSSGYMSIDNILGNIQFRRYYKDDYSISYARTALGDTDELLYFNCPNSGALTTAIDKMFDYVAKMPDNIKTD